MSVLDRSATHPEANDDEPVEAPSEPGADPSVPLDAAAVDDVPGADDEWVEADQAPVDVYDHSTVVDGEAPPAAYDAVAYDEDAAYDEAPLVYDPAVAYETPVAYDEPDIAYDATVAAYEDALAYAETPAEYAEPEIAHAETPVEYAEPEIAYDATPVAYPEGPVSAVPVEASDADTADGPAAPARRPLYPRLLHLQHIHPNAWQRAVLGEGALALAVLLVLADLATAWTLLVLPLAVAVVVKGHDLLAGALERGQTTPPGG